MKKVKNSFPIKIYLKLKQEENNINKTVKAFLENSKVDPIVQKDIYNNIHNLETERYLMIY